MRKNIAVLMIVLVGLFLVGCGDGSSSGGGGGPSPPTVLTGDGGQIYRSTSSTTGIGHGNVTSDGGVPPVFERGICWGTMSDPRKGNGNCVSTSAGTGPFSEILTGVPNDGSATYYMSAFASNSFGTSYGRSYLIALKTH